MVHFVDAIGKLMKDFFEEDLHSASYYSILTNACTDSNVLEEEVVFVFYLSDGEPVVKFKTIETPDHTHSDGLKESIETTFQNIKIATMYNFLSMEHQSILEFKTELMLK